MVARFGHAAVLVQLSGANFAAAAAVQDHAHARCALGHLRRTFTQGGARGGDDQIETSEEDNDKSKHQHLGQTYCTRSRGILFPVYEKSVFGGVLGYSLSVVCLLFAGSL